MAIKLNSGVPPKQIMKPAPAPQQAAPQPAPQAAPQPQYQAPQQAQAPQSTGAPSFMKKGAAAKATMEHEEKKAELRSKGQVFRFWVPKDKETRITFLDGTLVDGMLDIPFYFEHFLNYNGDWTPFICTQDDEPCPICEGGNSHSYVGALTVIDHSEYVSSKDGKTHKDNLRLFIAKRDTIKLLQKQAVKRGGSLRGCMYDVSRVGEKAASVGSHFEFVQQFTDAQLTTMYKPQKAGEQDRSQPVNYEEYLTAIYLNAKDLRARGFGHAGHVVGSEAAPSDYKGKL